MFYKDNKMYVEDNDIVELILANRQVKILPNNKTSYIEFEKNCKQFGLLFPFELDNDSDTITWNMPDNYSQLDIKEHIINKHKLNKEQLLRVDKELAEFKQRNLIDLLRFLVYFVDQLRTNNVVYGVGRGSSIASYVLYLIGVHRIDSLRYNLDIKEFLK